MTEQDGKAPSRLWGVILAGGEGRRVQSLMRRLTGIDLPKQFCAVVGRRSMLQHTLDRVGTLIPRHRIVTVIIRQHLVFARAQLEGFLQAGLVVQPCNRDTAPGLLLPLLWIQARDPAATVAIFPSDHFVREERLFMERVAQAVRFLREQPRRLILLGIVPDRPESAYGWIQPGEELATRAGGLFNVSRFWEKPEWTTAERLFHHGWLWNSLLMVGRLDTFLDCFREAMPGLWERFRIVAAALGTPREEAVLDQLYRDLHAGNLSRGLLETIPSRLGVVPVKGVHWCDWGDEARILATLARMGMTEEFRFRLGPSGEFPGGGWPASGEQAVPPLNVPS